MKEASAYHAMHGIALDTQFISSYSFGVVYVLRTAYFAHLNRSAGQINSIGFVSAKPPNHLKYNARGTDPHPPTLAARSIYLPLSPIP